MRLAAAWCWIEHEELVVHLFIDLHYASLISATVAVVRCGENCNNGFFVIPIEAVHHQLMSSGNQFQVVSMIEVLRYVLSKCEPGSSRRYSPAVPVVRIRPKQIAHWSFVRHLDLPVNCPDLVECIQIGREASMQAEDLILDYRCQRQ